jgi:hypothetical protein
MAVDVRKGMPPRKLGRAAFETRFRSRFVDPAFRPLERELAAIVAAAWDAYAAVHAPGRAGLCRPEL